MPSTLATKIQHCFDLYSFLDAHFPVDPTGIEDHGWDTHRLDLIVTTKNHYDYFTSEELMDRFALTQDQVEHFFVLHHWVKRHLRKQRRPLSWSPTEQVLSLQCDSSQRYTLQTLAQAIEKSADPLRSFSELETALYL